MGRHGYHRRSRRQFERNLKERKQDKDNPPHGSVRVRRGPCRKCERIDDLVFRDTCSSCLESNTRNTQRVPVAVAV